MAFSWEQGAQGGGARPHSRTPWDASSFEWDSLLLLAQPADGSNGGEGKESYLTEGDIRSYGAAQSFVGQEEGVQDKLLLDLSTFNGGGMHSNAGEMHAGTGMGMEKGGELQRGFAGNSASLASMMVDADCPNLKAGRVPCACTESDEFFLRQLKERRAEILTSLAAPACQVLDCSADIMKLKEYHQRHRVCEEHAKAATVFHCGIVQRYCQQCGRFHPLADFDEGKRSCRRKLERHNNRRRQKKSELRGARKPGEGSDDEQSPSSSVPEVNDASSDGGETPKTRKKFSESRKNRKNVEDVAGKVSTLKKAKKETSIKSVLQEGKLSCEVLSSSDCVLEPPSGSAASTDIGAATSEAPQVESSPLLAGQACQLAEITNSDASDVQEAFTMTSGTSSMLPEMPLSSSSVKATSYVEPIASRSATPWQPDNMSPAGLSSDQLIGEPYIATLNPSPPTQEMPSSMLQGSRILPPVQVLFSTGHQHVSETNSYPVIGTGFGTEWRQADPDHSLLGLLIDNEEVEQQSQPAFQQTQHTHNPSLSSLPPTNLGLFPAQQLAIEHLAYSPQHTTSRMSFKLYNWNPGDFPRSLRHQIMDWLAQMPSDLEGYIRPGCTVLTIRIAMPSSGWAELESNLKGSLQRLIEGQGKDMFGTGCMLVQASEQVAVVEDGVVTSVSRLHKMDGPLLCSVRPLCVQSGKPTQVVVRGCNFLLPATRLLCSTGGKYILSELIHAADVTNNACGADAGDLRGEDDEEGLDDSDEESSEGENGAREDKSISVWKMMRESFKFVFPKMDGGTWGSAHIEVEHGVCCSNALPLLVASESICQEVNTLAEEVEAAGQAAAAQVRLKGSQVCDLEEDLNAAVCAGLRARMKKEREVADLLEDLGWVLACRSREVTKAGEILVKETAETMPIAVNYWSSLERLKRLVAFAVERGWCAVTGELLHAAGTLDRNAALQGVCYEGEVVQAVGIDANGFSLLHGAVVGRHFTLAEELLNFGKKQIGCDGAEAWWRASWAGPGGLTPLHLAALQESAEDFVLLFASVGEAALSWTTARDVYGKTPRDYAAQVKRSHLDLIVARQLLASAIGQSLSSPAAVQTSKQESSNEIRLPMPCEKRAVEEEPLLSYPGSRKETSLRWGSWQSRLRSVKEGLSSCQVALRTERRIGHHVMASVLVVLVACACVCVLLVHPHQLQLLSMSFRRCLSSWRMGREHSSSLRAP